MVGSFPAAGHSAKVNLSYCHGSCMHITDSFTRTAELHGAKYVKQFSRVMWQQCGMRLVVIEAHHDTKDELCIAS